MPFGRMGARGGFGSLGRLGGVSRPLDVFLVAGQSNACVNNTTLAQVSTHLTASDTGIKIWNKTAQAWQTYDVTVNSNQPGDTSPSTGALWGPEAQFAFRYRETNPTKTVAFIKYAIGSRQLGQSGDGATTQDWSQLSTAEMFDAMTSQVTAGLAALRAQGYNPTVRALIWMQGEDDTLSDALANAYQANLGTFDTAMRSAWKLGPTGLFLVGQIQAAIWGARGTTVADAQAAYVVASPTYSRLIDTSAYVRGSDSTHFKDAYVDKFGGDLWIAYTGVPELAFNVTPVLGTATYSNSVRTISSLSTSTTIRALQGAISGKKVFGMKLNTVPGNFAGVGVGIATAAAGMGFDGNNSIVYYNTGTMHLNSATLATGAAFVANNSIGVVVDETAGRVWFTKDGITFNASTTFAQVVAGTGGLDISAVKALGAIYPECGSLSRVGVKWTFLSAYPFTLPTGFSQY